MHYGTCIIPLFKREGHYLATPPTDSYLHFERPGHRMAIH